MNRSEKQIMADAKQFLLPDAQRVLAAAALVEWMDAYQNREGALAEVDARIAARQADEQAANDKAAAAEAEAAARIAKADAARDAKLAALGAEQLTQEAYVREATAQADALRAEIASLEARTAMIRETLAAVRI